MQSLLTKVFCRGQAMTAGLGRGIRHGQVAALAAFVALGFATSAEAGDKLVATWGVSNVEGSAGGGLSPWAVIAGSGSRDQVAATAFATRWESNGHYKLDVHGAAVGLFDTVELSVAQWRFGLSDVVPGQSLKMDVFGAKWRVLGDAVYDQDRWWPQVALGLQSKRNTEMAVPTALGAKRGDDVDFYAAATKVWLGAVAGRNLVGNVVLRATRANQFGLLGFGGNQGDSRRLRVEGSTAVLLRDDLAVGFELRQKPDLLAGLPEETAGDVFVAWFPSRHLSLTLAWLELGNVAVKTQQHGAYLSLQLAL